MAPQRKGSVILGTSAPVADPAAASDASAEHGQRVGVSVGRSPFAEPAKSWPHRSVADADLILAVADGRAE